MLLIIRLGWPTCCYMYDQGRMTFEYKIDYDGVCACACVRGWSATPSPLSFACISVSARTPRFTSNESLRPCRYLTELKLHSSHYPVRRRSICSSWFVLLSGVWGTSAGISLRCPVFDGFELIPSRHRTDLMNSKKILSTVNTVISRNEISALFLRLSSKSCDGPSVNYDRTVHSYHQ